MMGGERGQASVEVVAGSVVVVLAGLIALQLLAAGYAAVMADHAAEAGALALADGRPAAAAAKSAVPAWPDRSIAVDASAGSVVVTLVPPSPFVAVRRRLAVTARAAVR